MSHSPQAERRTSVLRISLGHRIVYYLYKLLCFVLRCTDIRAVAVAGRLTGYIVWAAARQRRRIVQRNLRIVVDPTLRGRKLSAMARRNMVRTVMNLACSLKTGLMTSREMARFIHVEGGDIFEKNGIGGHTVISCIPHAGNWEALARIRPLFSRVPRFASMYRRLSNPLLEEFVYRSRTRYGCEMYSKEDGLREVLKLAREGGLLGVLSDQFTAEGLYLPYFGKVTGVTPLPAIIYKRCKGRGHLFSVFTRNTRIGHWDVELGREIHLPPGCCTLPAITRQVNLALEQCQKENILDGFWMHHRWKTTAIIAPETDDETRQLVCADARLPFRMLVAAPTVQEELRPLTHAVQALSVCRPDAQVIVLCPTVQQTYWATQTGVHRALPTDGKRSVAALLDEGEIYADGPFDVLFMFGGDARLWRQLRRIFPVYTTGFADHPLAKKFRLRYRRMTGATGAHTMREYAAAFATYHRIHLPE